MERERNHRGGRGREREGVIIKMSTHSSLVYSDPITFFIQ